jgi:hypothetical protein
MKVRVSHAIFSTIAVSTSCLLWSCGGAPENNGPENSGAIQQGAINGQLLHSIDLGDAHQVDFWEFADGQFAAHETLSMDSASRGVLTKISGETVSLSLSEIYRMVKPEAQAVPDVIANADLRAIAYRETHPAPAITPPMKPPSDDLTRNSGILPTEAISSAGATGCSADAFGDNYGAQWFLDNFCNQGGFQWCLTNRTSGDTGQRQSSWFKWNVMAPDFALTVNMSGGHWTCSPSIPIIGACGWVYTEDFNHSVQPRQINSWVYSGSGIREGYALGNASCRRVHYANLYNN